MTSDELKAMPKGQFIVMKTGFYPMKVRLKLFTQWGIFFDKEYLTPEHSTRPVAYGSSAMLTQRIYEKYCPEMLVEEANLEAEMNQKQKKRRKPIHAAPKADRTEQPDGPV